MEWLYSQKRGAASPKPPLLTITEPTGAASASAGAVINLSGAASDGRAGPASVTWTNYQNGQLAVGSGTATGRTHWAITNLSLSAGCTNLIVVTATTTSYNASLAGHTTFNGTLRVHP
jgi:hypothetical protein